MGKKERNVLARIERQSNILPPAKSLASRSDFKEISRIAMEWNSVPGEWKTDIIESESPPLSEEEQNALDDILSSCDGGDISNLVNVNSMLWIAQTYANFRCWVLKTTCHTRDTSALTG